MNPSRRSFIARAATALMVGAASLISAPSFAASGLPARTSDGNGVRVVVTPKATAPGAVWEFDVVMDTHTKPLDTDLARAAELIDDGGQRYQPLEWKGDPPGGHHRKGTLRFPAPANQIKAFEVQIQGIGGVGTRVFQWTMK
jgi:hypothetical protein